MFLSTYDLFLIALVLMIKVMVRDSVTEGFEQEYYPIHNLLGRIMDSHNQLTHMYDAP